MKNEWSTRYQIHGQEHFFLSFKHPSTNVQFSTIINFLSLTGLSCIDQTPHGLCKPQFFPADYFLRLLSTYAIWAVFNFLVVSFFMWQSHFHNLEILISRTDLQHKISQTPSSIMEINVHETPNVYSIAWKAINYAFYTCKGYIIQGRYHIDSPSASLVVVTHLFSFG